MFFFVLNEFLSWLRPCLGTTESTRLEDKTTFDLLQPCSEDELRMIREMQTLSFKAAALAE